MDAHALLTSQGWRGSGHSLHKTDDSIGLARPILVSRKNNSLGIGRKNHVTSDQWWLNAFDEQLKSLDTSNKTSVVQTKTNTTKLEGLLTHGAGKYTGANALYACFVSGGLLKGTLQTEEEDQSTDATPEAEAVPVRKETKEERRARREAKRQRKDAKLAKETTAASKVTKTTKSKAKVKDKLKSEKDDKSKKRKKSTTDETKGERRARKEAKRKEAKRKEKAKKEKRRKVEEG